MRKLTTKKYASYNYPCRYTTVPYFYDPKNKREVYGIGEQMSKKTSYSSHKIKPEDTLDSLALTYYNNPTYWWVIAAFNSILDPFINLIDNFDTIKIPNISSIEFKNER